MGKDRAQCKGKLPACRTNFLSKRLRKQLQKCAKCKDNKWGRICGLHRGYLHTYLLLQLLSGGGLPEGTYWIVYGSDRNQPAPRRKILQRDQYGQSTNS